MKAETAEVQVQLKRAGEDRKKQNKESTLEAEIAELQVQLKRAGEDREKPNKPRGRTSLKK